jgi:hypothetical protein
MRRSSIDWRIEDLQAVAKRHGIEWRQKGTSHVYFRHPHGRVLSVPDHGVIKPVYVKQFLALITGEESE